jgi:hypothetical protein
MSQNSDLLNALKSGHVEPMYALKQLGIYRLAARIRDLRESGHVIITEKRKVRRRGGGHSFVARYRLVL